MVVDISETRYVAVNIAETTDKGCVFLRSQTRGVGFRK